MLVAIFLLIFAQNKPVVKNPSEHLSEDLIIRSETAKVLREEEKRSAKKKTIKTVYLKLKTFVYHDEELPFQAPDELSFDGNYESVTQAIYLKSINAIRFKPQQEGEAVLTVIDGDRNPLIEYRIDVQKSKLDQVYRDLISLIGDIDGIELKILENKIIIDGQVTLVRDFQRIEMAITPFGEVVQNLVTMAPHSLRKIAELIAREINNPDIEVKAIESSIFIQGVVSSEDEKNRIETIARIFLPEITPTNEKQQSQAKKFKVAVMVTVKPPAQAPPPPPRLVQVVIHFVELAKDYRKGFLFDFSPEFSDQSSIQFQAGTGQNQGSSVSIVGIINNLFPRLNWAKSHGYARVLKSGVLLVQDTKTGSLRSTFRVPDNVIINPGGATQNQNRDVGFIFTVTPVILGERGDLINLTMKVDIATPFGIGQGLTNNYIETDIAIRSGFSAAIAGLLQNQSGQGYNKKQNPSNRALITLHADKDFNRVQNQFVLFVTPSIKANPSQNIEKIKQRFGVTN